MLRSISYISGICVYEVTHHVTFFYYKKVCDTVITLPDNITICRLTLLCCNMAANTFNPPHPEMRKYLYHISRCCLPNLLPCLLLQLYLLLLQCTIFPTVKQILPTRYRYRRFSVYHIHVKH